MTSIPMEFESEIIIRSRVMLFEPTEAKNRIDRAKRKNTSHDLFLCYIANFRFKHAVAVKQNHIFIHNVDFPGFDLGDLQARALW